MAFPAQYPGRCADCEQRFDVDTEIRYDANDEIVHAVCPDAPTTARPAPLCPQCWTEHRGACL